jgi:hypothetical protein
MELWGVIDPASSKLVNGVVCESDLEAMAMAAKKLMGGSSAGKLGKLLQQGYRAVKVTVTVKA